MKTRRPKDNSPAAPAPSKQVSAFRSPAARRLGFFGSVVGAGVGVFAGMCSNVFGGSSHLVRDTVAGGAATAATLGTFGLLTGAAATTAGRTQVVKSATSAVVASFKNRK